MPIVPYTTLLAHAERRAYALGYFECWDLASLLSVLAAAEETVSPVIVGFNGAYLPDVCRRDPRGLHAYGEAGREAIARSRAPAGFIFNESPYMEWVEEALGCGFNAVMYTDEGLPVEERIRRISALVKKAHAGGIAVEAELGEPPNAPQGRETSRGRGKSGAQNRGAAELLGPAAVAADTEGGGAIKTDPGEAAAFVRETGVDALGVLVGNRHYNPGAGGEEPGGPAGGGPAKAPASAGPTAGVTLDVELVARLKKAVPASLVLHAGSGVAPDSLREGIRAGIRRINIGRAVKEPAYHAIRERFLRSAELSKRSGSSYPGYEVLGSGREEDIDGGVREAVAEAVMAKLSIFGSCGMAGDILADSRAPRKGGSP